ncbi:MAG TPA: hypothetical protein VIM16_09815 [Mucilaginibacter sp.]|jgi:hypothetical protein
MAEKYIISKRNRFSLAGIEMVTVSIFSSYWLCKRFDWDWLIGVAVFFASNLLIGWLFFRVRLFRYILSILFSFFWGFLAYTFSTGITESTVSLWIALVVVFLISLALHWSYFDFERNASRIEYRDL